MLHVSGRTIGLAALVAALTGCSGGAPADNKPATPEEGAPEAKTKVKPPKRNPAADVTPKEKLKAPEVKQPAPASLPDVIVLTLDTTRADHLSTYGYLRQTAPRLDAFAKTAIVFDRLVVPMATTLPTHTSLFTGVYPIEHGIAANVEHGGNQFIPTEKLIPFAGWLADQGYQTGGFTSCSPLKPETGIERGFQIYTAPKGELRPGRATVDDALGWLETTRADAPLLMWVHFYDPHNPYAPDPKYLEQFKADDTIDAWIKERKLAQVTERPTGEKVQARPTINAYDAEIRTMDDQIGRVLDALAARGRLDSSLVIVMGDHGEGLNQHDEPGHGLVWDEQLHAPLFIKAPGAAPRRVATTVSAVDVLPTALGLVDLPGEDRLRAQFSGRDALADTAPRAAMSQMSGRQVGLGREMTFALTDDQYKCTWVEGGEVKVWDLKADPHELAEPRGTHPEVAERCRAELTAMVARQRARAEELGAGKTRPMSDAQRKELELLGYLESAGGGAPPADKK